MIPAEFDLATRLDQHAAADGSRVALIFAAEQVTFADLALRSDAVANALLAAGLGPGDRVVHVATDSPALYELLYGCARIGAVLVPVNWRLAADELDFVVKHCGARVVITDRPDVDAETTVQPSNFAHWRDTATAAPLPKITIDRNTPVVQMYTSGTTGRPKGVVLAHRTFNAVRELLDHAGLDWLDWRAEDVSLIALPAFHIGGMWWATQALNSGLPSVVLPRFAAAAAAAAVRDHGVTVTCFVPAMILMLLSDPDIATSDLITLRKVAYGGSPIGPDLLARAIETIDCEFAQIYGLTETGNTAVCLPPEQHWPGHARLHAAGTPYPGVAVAIRDSGGNELPTGMSGEVYLRSPAQMLEYFADPVATAATIVDGWVRTGDAGYIDDDGFLVLRDRVKDLIIVSGENVYPAEVEKTINSHPDVHDSAVVGAPDDRRGERVHAFIVAEPDSELSCNDLTEFLSRKLARFKVPSHYEFVESIPRNPSGKILRRDLRERFWVGMDRQVH
ncbi:AMP-binding protein [Mycobacterium sp. CBMA293]|uniref:AMP-binding protein n=1 Tax=unclassified Mycolicibacterium TaxID=2636767 RepID=UPI0012DF3EF9|nr:MULTISPECIES: AMP-binding protein [unclassified Mycolicibacterium]MUL44663.1 AMP-binding protein [Mycolicibacterium sp. CBMA 360]MUL93779.1 AMP-binding protein [Mycolicibacterium sp. CBMA 230]MUL59987.1 AMP-binding protein [Mycolicibacterium sp. CBMA 335]MUL68830.1 AMP-binding protein [Mycolicibacterium sp. CBMA 311]MUM12961.1 AMP-binding protein [Mycolicibacterium sp. CBMA 293]